MIIINQPGSNTKAYTILIGEDNFLAYANNEAEAAEAMAEYLISHEKSDWYFDDILGRFINTSELYYCPKHNVYLPKLTIKEASI